MSFVPISLEEYVRLHVRSNPDENPAELRKRLQAALQAKLAGMTCHCGNPIWVVGSATAGHACFTAPDRPAASGGCRPVSSKSLGGRRWKTKLC